MTPFRSKFALALVTLAFVACSETPRDERGYLTSQSEYQVAFVWHPVNTRTELYDLYAAGGGVIPTDCLSNNPRGIQRDACDLRGFTARAPDGTQHVYTLRPFKVDDDTTLTLGHEVMHVALGDYHP